MAQLGKWLAEFRRRQVVRDSLVYVATTWALAQGVAQIGPAFGLSDRATRWFVLACAIGFPFWLWFAWHYDITLRGIHREAGRRSSDARDPVARHQAAPWVFACMAIAIVLLAANQFVLRRDVMLPATNADTPAVLAALAKAPEHSVAVMPLTNEGGDPKQQYFSDGLSEQLISDLAQLDGLKVIGNYSSFKFRDSSDSLAKIGATLGVAYLVDGSVQQDSGRLRVVVNLLRAHDGTSVWSHTYDRKLDDVFAVQSEISGAVANALRVKLLHDSPPVDERPPGGNVEAYRLALQARDLARRMGHDDLLRSVAMLREAVAIDPKYAYGWGLLSHSLVNLGGIYLKDNEQRQVYADARTALAKEVALAPDSASTYLDQGYVRAQLDLDQTGALAAYQRAYDAAPGDAGTTAFFALQLAIVGRVPESAALFQKAVAVDPLNANWHAGLATTLATMGRLDEAEREARESLALQPASLQPHLELLAIDALRGDRAAAAREADEVTKAHGPGEFAHAVAAQLSPNRAEADSALRNYVTENSKHSPYNTAIVFALNGRPDEMFAALDRAWVQRDPNLLALLYSPFILRYQNDPRFGAFRAKIGLPVATGAPEVRP